FADELIIIRNVEDLEALNIRPSESYKILGAGSNILLTGDLHERILKNEILGRTIEESNEVESIVRIGSGENWHELVLWTLDQELGGLENLSLIPGTAGAAPVQNIGAYGVELKDVLLRVEGYFIRERKPAVFDLGDCEFGYRSSIFKTRLKEFFFITAIWLRLSRKPVLKLRYGSIQDELDRMQIKQPTIRDVSQAVIRIRQSKLPDPARIGNAGSFFKNVNLTSGHYEQLKLMHPGLPGYPEPDGSVKVPAGWLIEQCGWKGKRDGDAGCYDQQALVLVNYGQATGRDILAFSQKVSDSVFQRFGIRILPEVNLW
ncbi:MAG TPA: UDP-N-acetylmuramate dehydrogenase, partial [Saprospiraceae bacterium]|nr:UDP-N-acetylmuramate dehydrogenase [Saprospiraceae bacterium]